MLRMRLRIAALAATLAAIGALCFAAAPASANPVNFAKCVEEFHINPGLCLPINGQFNHWHTRGTLVTGGQTIALAPPEGGDFTGVGLLELRPGPPAGVHITGEIDGQATFPPFTAEIEFPKGSKEHQVAGMTLTPVGAINGNVESTSPANCPNPIAGTPATCVTLTVPTEQQEALSVVGPGNGLPSKTVSHCETVEPVKLNLSTNLTLLEIVAVGSHFTGAYTVPRITCAGKYGVGRGEQMTEAFSGPGTYDLTTTPQ